MIRVNPRVDKIVDWLSLITFLAILGTFLVGASWLLGIGTPTNFTFPRPFSSELWKQVRLDDPDSLGDERCQMVYDLRYRIGLKGRTRAEILRLLGPSDDSGMRDAVST
jgi:hypothetical protein